MKIKQLDEIDSKYQTKADVYLAIQEKGKYSAGNVIDIINSHEKVYLESSNITNVITGFIQWALLNKSENVARYILREYAEIIKIPSVLYSLTNEDVDPLFIMDIMDLWKPYSAGTSTIDLVKQALFHINDEYFEILLDDGKILNTLKKEHIKNMFGNRFSTKKLLKGEPRQRWEKVLNTFSEINKTMSEVASENTTVLETFYPEANDIFVF